MLNGKFYTGLTPKMINRDNSQVTNRLESHFYWPDDTDTESAVETRVRRRASLSLAPTNKPVVQKRNDGGAAAAVNEVNTKQMLHNQFSKSSIQFFDNINEEDEVKTFRRAQRKEITGKPTATKLELPDSDVDAAALKNKHMFVSKLQFNDFIGEDLNKRNNMRTNKIDMNNKMEVERNSKNSPKLQNKRNVQNLMQYNNSDDEEREWQRQSRAKTLEFRNRNNNKYRRDQTPKRILKPAMRNGVDYSNYPECRDEDFYNEAADQIDTAFKHMQINSRRPILKKRVSYSEEEEEIPVRHYYKRRDANDHDDDDDDDDDNNNDELYMRKHKNQYKFGHTHAYAPNGRRTQPSNDLDQDQHFVEKSQRNNHINNNDNNEISNTLVKSVNSNSNNNNNENNNRGLNVAHKHLRSSLCFHDGEIVGSDNEATLSTSSVTGQRRNARSSATKRVSVGLPD